MDTSVPSGCSSLKSGYMTSVAHEDTPLNALKKKGIGEARFLALYSTYLTQPLFRDNILFLMLDQCFSLDYLTKFQRKSNVSVSEIR